MPRPVSTTVEELTRQGGRRVPVRCVTAVDALLVSTRVPLLAAVGIPSLDVFDYAPRDE
jgi:hypothetical protein